MEAFKVSFLLLQPDGFKFAVFFFFKLQGLEGLVVHEFQVPPIPWSLFRSRRRWTRSDPGPSYGSSGWLLLKSVQVFSFWSAGEVPWVLEFHDFKTCFMCKKTVWFPKKLWGCMCNMPPKSFNQKMLGLEKGPKNMPRCFFRKKKKTRIL